MTSKSRKPTVTCPPQLRRQIDAAIVEQLETPGRPNWDVVRERPEFAHMIGKAAGEAGRRKFFNWVAKLRGPMPADRTRPHQGREMADQAFAAAKDWSQQASEHLPIAPSPAYRMRLGARADEKINIMRELRGLVADAQRLKAEAMEPDPAAEDGWRIGDRRAYEAAIKLQGDLLSKAMTTMRDLCDLQQLVRYPEIVAEIVEEELSAFPEVQARILGRLADLPNSLGLARDAGML